MREHFQEYLTPKKLHPLTIPFNILARNSGVFVAMYFAFNSDSFEGWTNLLLIMIFLVLPIPFIVLSYFNFYYFITPEEVVIHSGIISKQQRNIPVKRVQNIEVNQNFLQRIFRIASVSIETAGGSETEGKLNYVSLEESEIIRSIIKTYQKESTTPEEQSSDEKSPEMEIAESEVQNVFKLGIRDLVKYAMLRFRPVVFFFGASVYAFAQQFFPELIDSDYITYLIENQFNDVSMTESILIIAALVIVGMIASWIVDIILTVFKFFNFTLNVEDDKLFTEYGLFNKRKSTIPLRKMQMISIFTNPIRQKFNQFALSIETAGLGIEKGAELLMPSAPLDFIKSFINTLIKYDSDHPLNSVSKKTIRRAFIKYNITFLFFITPPAFIFDYAIFYSLILTVPLSFVFAYFRWKYRKWAVLNNLIIIKSGFIFRRTSIIPIEKIQNLHIYETFFQRRLGLSTLYIDTAAGFSLGDAAIIDLDHEEAKEINLTLSSIFYKNLNN